MSSGPSEAAVAAPRRGWDRVAEVVARHPGRTLVLAVLPMLVAMLAVPTMTPSHDTLASLPDDADSVRGFEAIEERFDAAEGQPVVIVFDDDEPMHTDARLEMLGDLSRSLARLPGVASARSAAMPTGGDPPEEATEALAELEALGAEVDGLSAGLDEAAAGAGRLAQGVREVEQALDAARSELPELVDGLDEAAQGAGALVAGLHQARGGVGELRGGADELRTGLAEARAGAGDLRVQVADPAAASLKEAMEAFEDAFVGGVVDPNVRRAAEATGEAFTRVTGRFPPGHPREGQQAEPGYEGLSPALAELDAGLGDAIAGVDALDAGLGELAVGLDELIAGAQQLQRGLIEGADAVAALREGTAELAEGVRRELGPGAEELAQELREGAAELDEELGGVGGPALPGVGGQPFMVTASMLEQQPQLRESLGFFTTPDGTRTRMVLTLTMSPFSNGAIELAREIERTSELLVADSPLSDADMYVTGSAAFLSEVDAAAARDFPIIVGAVIFGVAAVVALLLRSVVIPLYMVATVLLTYGAALGATTVVFQHVLGYPGIEWWIPPMLFVLLVVLGVDYSIFLMSRVREEAGTLATRDAVTRGLGATGGVITSCGVILAGTFAAMLAAPLTSLVTLGFAASVGILLDTFVVRALVVPSVATLLGRHNWWPSSRARAA